MIVYLLCIFLSWSLFSSTFIFSEKADCLGSILITPETEMPARIVYATAITVGFSMVKNSSTLNQAGRGFLLILGPN